MTLAILIYLASLLGNLNIALVCAISLSLSYVVVQCIRRTYFSDMHRLPYNEEEEALRLRLNKSLKIGIIWLSIFATLGVLVPKEKTAWLMLGGYAAQTVYESDEGQKYRKLIMQKIDEAIGETAKATQGEKP